MVASEHPRHDDVAALDQSRRLFGARFGHVLQHLPDPWPGGVDDRPRGHDRPVAKPRRPVIGLAPRPKESGPRGDRRPALLRIERVEHHQPGIVDPAVRIDEPALDRLQPRAPLGPCQPHAERSRQPRPPADPVVQQQPQPDQPRRTHPLGQRHDKAHRADQMRRDIEQFLALGERLADQPKLVHFEVAKPAVDQLGARRRGMRGQVVALDQQHLQPAPGGVARDPGPVDPAADDEQVILPAH